MPFEPVMATGVGHGEHIKPLAQAWGDPVSGTVGTNRANAAGEHIRPAGLFSTAPYVDPAKQRAEREAAEAAEEASQLEAFARSAEAIGVDPTTAVRRGCQHKGCRSVARRESDYCRWHQEV